MANLPLRQLGSVGVVTDSSPYDLPPNGISGCNNVIFAENRVQRAPVFKALFPPIMSPLTYSAASGTYAANPNVYEAAEGGSPASSRFVGCYTDPAAGETVFVCDADGTVRSYPNGSLDIITPTGTTVTNNNAWTHAQVAGVSFLARAGMVPYARNILTDSKYSLIGGDWVYTDTAAIARPFMDFCLMLNINRNGTPLPTLVKWNNPAPYSSSLAGINWDPANPNYISGENTIGEMRDPIRDGLTLGANFIIYSQNQLWLQQYVGGTEIFSFQRIPFEGGIINANCVVEIDSKHYVFGDNDIYVHDGMTKLSLAEGRVRRRIFNTIDRSKQNFFFVAHDSVSKLLHFCYASLQEEATFNGVAFCNQAATYNYKNDTWSFMDLPNIIGGTEANASLVQDTFAQNDTTYGQINTPYTSFSGGGTPRISTMLGVSSPSYGLTASRVYAIDLPANGIVNLPANSETIKPAYVERIGLSLDTQGLPLRTYKLVQSVEPEAFFDDSTGTFTMQFGSSDRPEQSPNYKASVTYDPNTDYKVDMMVAGRYLAYKISTSAIANFQISGMDCEIKPLSRR